MIFEFYTHIMHYVMKKRNHFQWTRYVLILHIWYKQVVHAIVLSKYLDLTDWTKVQGQQGIAQKKTYEGASTIFVYNDYSNKYMHQPFFALQKVKLLRIWKGYYTHVPILIGWTSLAVFFFKSIFFSKQSNCFVYQVFSFLFYKN